MQLSKKLLEHFADQFNSAMSDHLKQICGREIIRANVIEYTWYGQTKLELAFECLGREVSFTPSLDVEEATTHFDDPVMRTLQDIPASSDTSDTDQAVA